MEGGFCTHCGQPRATGTHEACEHAVLEPPRYCVQCGRRMVVQVTPDRWTAHCSRHGLTAGTA